LLTLSYMKNNHNSSNSSFPIIGGGATSKLIAFFAIFTLSFFSLTTITFSTQNAQAATAPLCGPASGTGAEPVTGFDTAAQGWSLSDSFTGLSTPSQLASTSLDVSANISSTSSTLFYNKATTSTDHFDSYYNNDKQPTESLAKLVIPARPAGPSVTSVASSDVGASDGKITGTSNKMEYNTTSANFAGSWTAVGGSAITGLTSGTYFVRTIADQSTSKFKSFAKEVIVKEGSSPSSGPSAGKPGSGTGPTAGNSGTSSEGTAQTGVDFAGLELLALLMVACGFGLRRYLSDK
jgi:hypothetical protein